MYMYILYSNHIDLQIRSFYIKSFVHHQLCLNCIFIFKFFKNSMIVFKNYKKLSEWLVMLLMHLH